jgi:CRISPR-associated protein Cas2
MRGDGGHRENGGVERRRALSGRGAEENLYIVAYDISDQRRWRRVFRLMNGYGEWVQLSVFQCRLSRRRRIELKFALGEIIDHAQDHVVILDLGPAEGIRPRVDSLGKPFTVVARGPVIV